MELNKIHNIDCRFGMLDIDSDSIDLVVTSPPYKAEDGYDCGLMMSVAHQSYRILKPNSLCFVNFGHLAKFKSRPFNVARYFEQQGFEWIDTITWIKKQYTPLQGDKRLNNLTEFIFMFAKGSDYHLDRLAIGIPYDDKSNVGRYADIDLHCGGNVFIMGYETIQRKEQKLHKDRFPVELPDKCIKLANLPKGSVVLDPFCGSGTTAVAAVQNGMQYVGFEVNEKNWQIANERLGTR
jgi:site-specific DNA-methyltransferase (adenine-specific)